jgi:heme/copper-type cytochrome/quinol oxidase subunit 2
MRGTETLQQIAHLLDSYMMMMMTMTVMMMMMMMMMMMICVDMRKPAGCGRYPKYVE